MYKEPSKETFKEIYFETKKKVSRICICLKAVLKKIKFERREFKQVYSNKKQILIF